MYEKHCFRGYIGNILGKNIGKKGLEKPFIHNHLEYHLDKFSGSLEVTVITLTCHTNLEFTIYITFST